MAARDPKGLLEAPKTPQESFQQAHGEPNRLDNLMSFVVFGLPAFLASMAPESPDIVKALRPVPPTLKDDDDDVLPTALPQVQDMGGRPLGGLLEAVLRPPWGCFGASFGPPGGLLGPPGGLLEASWGTRGGLPGPLGAEGSTFGFVFPFLGLSWGRLGALSGNLGGLLGRRGASKSRKGDKANTFFHGSQRIWVLGALFACVRMQCTYSIHAVFLYACAFVRMHVYTYA